MGRSTVKVEDFGKRLKKHKVGSGRIRFGGHYHPYDVENAELNPDVHCFVGRYMGRWFISADVDPAFREAWIVHEIECAKLKEKHGYCYCAAAIHVELHCVPKGRLLEYCRTKHGSMKQLVSYKSRLSEPDLDFIREITVARDVYGDLCKMTACR